MPRLPAKQREAEKVATKLTNGSYAAAVNDSPARFSWEEHAIKLLSKMTGDRRKRKNTLEGFIAALIHKREEFRKEKKTGAGCATEAIEFYQFVLGKNASWKAKAGKKTSKDTNSPTRSPSKDEEAEEVDDDDDGDANVDGDGDVTDDEFLEEHNDICEVCGVGGELLCCTTCNLVFHLSCVSPSLKSMPPDTWSCAHCDATGVTGLKKDSRQRKRAIAAVREMNKAQGDAKDNKMVEGAKDNATSAITLTTTFDGGDIAKAEESDGGSCRVCSYGGDLFNCNQEVCNHKYHLACVRPIIDEKPDRDWNCAYCDVDFVTGLKPQARRRRAAISGVRAMDKLKTEYDVGRKSNILPESNMKTPTKRKLEEMNAFVSPIHPGQPRSQRLRKQIEEQEEKEKTIVKEDNSDVSSSTEKIVAELPKAPKYNRDEIPSDLIKKLTPKATNSNSRHGQYNCKFCMDDEIAETCCFCACRVCFTKHRKAATILCDLCDGEYHINCLSPPLSQIPSLDWFCPTCTDAIVKGMNAPKTTKSAPSKKGSKSKGGKAGSKIASKKGATKAKAKLALKQKKAAYSAMQPRTTAGRFATKMTRLAAAASANALSSLTPTFKRGPGRPPKSASKESSENKPGRPRESATKAAASIADSKPMFSASGGMVRTVTQQRSRSGRVVKRKAAYDEREEGAQLLKSTTSASLMTKNEEINSSRRTHNDTDLKGMPSSAAMIAANAVITAMNQHNGEATASLMPSLTHNIIPLGAMLTGTLLDKRFQAVDATKTQPLPSPKSALTKIQLTSQDAVLGDKPSSNSKNPRRKPGARECMQISRRFGTGMIPPNYMEILLDYCSRGKVEHLIRMRERLDEHSRFLESQLAGLECLALERGKMSVPTTLNAAEKSNIAAAPPTSLPVVTVAEGVLPATVSVHNTVEKRVTPAPNIQTLEKAKPTLPKATAPIPVATQAYVPMVPPATLTVPEPPAPQKETSATSLTNNKDE